MTNIYTEQILAEFRALLESQLSRCESMENKSKGKDFSKCDCITIGICEGDGIGKIIMKSALSVANYLLDSEISSGKIIIKKIDGLTIENRMKEGRAVPEQTLSEIKKCDVLLKGPCTTPKGGNLESANVALRRELDLYANIRPVSIPDEGIDWVFFRENTEGEYILGSKGVEIPGKLAFDFKVTTNHGSERIARAAFDYARQNGKRNISIVTKANIMKKTDGLFSQICHEVAKDYPEMTVEDWYIDIMSANLVNKDIRNKFEVFILPNLYGDIITDEAAQIQGGVGTAGSANIGDRYAMFEAVHGSAPRMIEQGLGDYANPSSIIRALEMLLRHIGYTDKANSLSDALHICNDSERRLAVTGDRNGASASEFTDYLLDVLKEQKNNC